MITSISGTDGKNKIPEYRIGSVVLFFDSSDNTYKIVDGQQRVTTLSILFYCLSKVSKNLEYESYSKLLTKEEAFNELSSKAIIENKQVKKVQYSKNTAEIILDSYQSLERFIINSK